MTPEKQAIADFLNHYLSFATIIGALFCVLWVIALIYSHKTKKEVKLFLTLVKYALPLGFFVSVAGTVMTLYYSDYLGILPCGLCWFERTALYSQVFLFGLAWYKKDFNIFSYTLVLSVFGGVVAIYHHYLQIGYSEFFPCPVVVSTIDCAKPTFVEYGFVTFPFMAVVLFSMLILQSITVKRLMK